MQGGEGVLNAAQTKDVLPALDDRYGFWDGRYICTQAKHTINENGYTTTVTGRRILEGY